MKTATCISVLAALTGVSSLAHADAFFSETNFSPGSWTALPTFSQSTGPGATLSAMSAPLAVPGGPMRQDFTLDLPVSSGFSVIYAPIALSGWTYDPSVDGAVGTISASVRTLPQIESSPGFGAIRFFLFQNGRQYTLNSLSPNEPINFPTFEGHGIDSPEQVRTASALVPTDFIRILPGVGFDFDDHPDYAAGPMSFGFGYSMTSTGIVGVGTVTLPVAFDDVSVRITTIPAPGAAAVLGLGAVLASRRRRVVSC